MVHIVILICVVGEKGFYNSHCILQRNSDIFSQALSLTGPTNEMDDKKSGKRNSAFEKDVDDEVDEVKDNVDTADEATKIIDKTEVFYKLNDIPSWYISTISGLQHFLLAFNMFALPLLIAPFLCIPEDSLGNVARANVISSLYFVSGINTVLQTALGIRLPIMQGISGSHLPPTLALLSLPHNRCPAPLPQGFMNSTTTLYNDTDGSIIDGDELWQRRMRELQGALAVSSVVEIVFGLTGAVGFLLRFIGPITIVPTIVVSALSLYSVSASFANGQWGIAIFMIVVLTLCSQYLTNVSIPMPFYSKAKKCHFTRVYIFKLYPAFVSVALGYILCVILTYTNAFPKDRNKAFYLGRIDVRADAIYTTSWFRFPYPGQWGLPTITVAGFAAMLAAIVASAAESIGHYYACANVCKVPPPPPHAINRGIAIEGLGSVLAGVIGVGSATSSFAENIAIIEITKVGSRRVLEVAGCILIFIGMFPKFASLFVTVPEPLIGGLLIFLFASMIAVGLQGLSNVDVNSYRNCSIIGLAVFIPIVVAYWSNTHPGHIQTGAPILDQVITVLLQSSVFVACVIAFILDNTIPGTPSERGLGVWKTQEGSSENKSTEEEIKESYDLPFPTSCCGKYEKYIPFLPGFLRKGSAETAATATSNGDMRLEEI